MLGYGSSIGDVPPTGSIVSSDFGWMSPAICGFRVQSRSSLQWNVVWQTWGWVLKLGMQTETYLTSAAVVF